MFDSVVRSSSRENFLRRNTEFRLKMNLVDFVML